ncbi:MULTISPECIES: hypothetical protein [Pseudoalteromonas]|uniref:Uncharacterized protein n=1 Tax=Pseudoalteromonas rubra TaxID=43658 RepID=A0A7S7YWQ3_9GAMM|nr:MULTISPECIES: hypothetical protein [Pseudoalteromonas]MCG7563693.1 hypothetical protein [Pseudoalteromonas sp. McH1-42]MEC4090312.1 hypothetical protein [Pseudoalteromonas rubra]QPB85034.1 hypothetical protein CWC22_019395 [Pseudoalteromonas rubra]
MQHRSLQVTPVICVKVTAVLVALLVKLNKKPLNKKEEIMSFSNSIFEAAQATSKNGDVSPEGGHCGGCTGCSGCYYMAQM